MSEPDIARSESLNVREALATLDFHATKAAKAGDYGCHSDLMAVRDVIEQLQDEVDALKIGGRDLMRQILAARESMSNPL